MKTWKKFITFALCVCMVLSLVACGSDTNDSGMNETDSNGNGTVGDMVDDAADGLDNAVDDVTDGMDDMVNDVTDGDPGTDGDSEQKDDRGADTTGGMNSSDDKDDATNRDGVNKSDDKNKDTKERNENR